MHVRMYVPVYHSVQGLKPEVGPAALSWYCSTSARDWDDAIYLVLCLPLPCVLAHAYIYI
jgi:hypothetical protein